MVTSPPLICIEILSPGDTASDLEDRLFDYLSMGVPGIWIFDPRNKGTGRLKIKGSGCLHPLAKTPRLICRPVELNPREIFDLAAE